ncbi:MAG: hypothetical protein WDA21_00665 [Bacilli bacterium]
MKNLSGEEIVILANAIALMIAQGKTTEEINYMTSIVFAIASSMNLIANQRDFLKGKEGQSLI